MEDTLDKFVTRCSGERSCAFTEEKCGQSISVRENVKVPKSTSGVVVEDDRTRLSVQLLETYVYACLRGEELLSTGFR